MSSSKRPSSSSFTSKPGNMSKKFRQTTLPWAPAPRPKTTAVLEDGPESPYFAKKSKQASPPPSEPAKNDPEDEEEEEVDSQKTTLTEATDDGEGDSQRTEDFDSQFSQFSEMDSQLSISTTSAEEDGKQFTFPVPAWSRPIHKRNMAREFYKPAGARHKFNEARVAAETLSVQSSRFDELSPLTHPSPTASQSRKSSPPPPPPPKASSTPTPPNPASS